MAHSESLGAGPVAPAPLHERETERLAALRSLGLLDSPSAFRFDAITELAKLVFEVPIALISLVDRDRQWFLSRQGLNAVETSRNIAFCAYAIHETQILVVENALSHPVFSKNPLVTGELGIRFYAGAVLRSTDGMPLGTLCVIDTVPREFDARARRTLLALARMAQSEMLLPPALSAGRARAQVYTNRDPITGRLWGDTFFERVEDRRRATVGEQHLVVSVHVESMGYFSNMYGRLVADEISIAVCERSEWALSAEGRQLLARLDNDWFAGIVTLPRGTDAALRLERLRCALADALRQPLTTAVGSVHIRAAVGLAVLDDADRNAGATVRLCRLAAAELAEPADVRAVVVDGALRDAATRRQRLSGDLSSAIDGDALSLVFQPKIDAESQGLAGLECLLRWHHPALGLVLPTEVLEIASESGLSGKLDRWVLATAMGHAARWQRQGYTFGRVSVNIMTPTLVDPAFQGWLHEQLDAQDVSPQCLDLEIVESAVVSDLDATVEVMRRLRDDGVTFSLDDFGTGFSSLSILRELPVSTLKIDKSFVERVGDDARAASLCSGIVNLAHELGLNTVAEGVETTSQSGILRALRCDQLQGYCFDKPLSAEDFEARYGAGAADV
ncbi:MAG: sensor domain-containing phosphodiesterase [Pseudomonadota bacterium]